MTENSNNRENTLHSSNGTVIFTKLSVCFDLSSILNAQPDNITLNSIAINEITKSATENYRALMSSNSSRNTSKSLRANVLKMIPEKNCDFEGVMIGNGAAKSPSRLPAYPRYCVFTNSTPIMHPSNCRFSGI